MTGRHLSLIPAFTDEPWMDRGACVGEDPDLFHPPMRFDNKANDWEPARAICDSCDVRVACLEYALGYERGRDRNCRFGFWGGHTPAERARLARTRPAPNTPRTCPQNHVVDGDNVYTAPSSGLTRCRTCLLINNRRSALRRSKAAQS